MSNLAGLCATHHGVIHRHHWALDLQPDGTLVFTRPDATVLTSPPPRLRRRPALPLHHPKLRGVIPALPDPALAGPEPDRPEPTELTEPTERDTALMVRARVVDLVHCHHRARRLRHQPPGPDGWPDADDR